jgi:hypothetical protein
MEVLLPTDGITVENDVRKIEYRGEDIVATKKDSRASCFPKQSGVATARVMSVTHLAETLRRLILTLLLAMTFGSLAMRYPTGHEVGVDSFAMHTMAESIVVSGDAAWILSPLSYFGLYPVSYPSAGPFLLASLSITTGIEIEGTILFSSLLLGVAGILTSFVMAREFRRTGMFAVTVAFVYAFAPRFLAFTLWQASTRNLFMALLPLFVWSMLRFQRQRSAKNLFIGLVSIAILAASHHLVILALVMAAALLFSIILRQGYRVVRTAKPRLVMKATQLGVVRWAGLTAALVVGTGFVIGTNVLSKYKVGELVSGDNLQVELLNLAVSITRSVGLAAPLAIVGLLCSPWMRSASVPESFAIAGLIALTPTLLFREYTGFYILPFLSLFAAYGLLGMSTRLRLHPRASRSMAFGLCVAILVASGTILDYEIAHNPPISGATYSAATYLRVMSGTGTVVCNEAVTCSRVAAIGGIPILPPAAGSASDPSPEVLIFGFYSSNELRRRIVPAPFQDFRFDTTLLWTVADINPLDDYAAVVQSPVNRIPVTLSTRYNPLYYLETSSGIGVFYGSDGRAYRSILSVSLHDGAYAVYADGPETVWWI